MLGPAGTTTYTYDTFDRLTSATDPNNATVAYQYDNANNLTSITYPGSKTVSYSYDNVNRLQTITDWNTQQTSYQYNNNGTLSSRILPNGVSSTYTYDAANRLIGLQHSLGSTVLAKYDYTRNSVGNITIATESGVLAASTAATPTPLPSPALVQKNLHSIKATSNAVTFSSNVTTGNTIVVGITRYLANITSVTDNQGNTYTPVHTSIQPGTDFYVDMYYAKNVTGGSVTVTVAFDSNHTSNVGVYEYSGLDKTAPLDQVTATTGSGTAPNGGTLTTTTDNEVYFAVGFDDWGNNAAPTAGSGYTLENHQDDSMTLIRYYAEDRVSTHGSYSTNLTIGGGSDWGIIGASFKPASAAVAPSPTPALVQKNFQSINASSNSVSFSSNVTSGNTIVVGITQYTATLSTVTDNKGNTYTPVHAALQPGTSDYVELYYAKNVTGGPVTVTASFSSAHASSVGIYEYSGLDKNTPLDQVTANTGSGTAPNGGTLTTTVDNEVYFAVGFDDYGNNAAPTAGSGYTLENHQDDINTHERFYSEDKVAAHGSYSTNFSIAAASDWGVIGVTFKPAYVQSVTTYTYDSLGRVTSAVSGQNSYSYTYDKVGNILIATVSGQQNTYTYNSDNELTNKNGTTYSYDSNGNQLSGSQKTFSFDFENRLLDATNSATSQMDHFTYDGKGNRLAEKINGTPTLQYVNDVQSSLTKVLEINNIANNTQDYYVYGAGLVSQGSSASTGRKYLLEDGLGNIRYATDNNGNSVQSFAYNPYGNTPAATDATAFQYKGEQSNALSSLYYMRARYYDPSTGRFISRDPVEGQLNDPQTQNGYNYADDNPVNLSDPSGRNPLGTCIQVTEQALQHINDTHVIGGIANTISKSTFAEGLDLNDIFDAAKDVEPVIQQGGNLIRTFDYGDIVGNVRTTFQLTPIVTVITNAAGQLLSAFPGAL
jgi:RHS repeat-associated protein